MTVSKEQAMQMFDRDLEILMDDLRGMQAHYQIADWDAFVFLRKPGCPESYVVKYAAADDAFAKQIVQLHAAAPAPPTQPEGEQEPQSPWQEAATIVEACLNVHSMYSDAEREFAAHLIEVFKTRDQHPDYKHRNTVRAYPAAASSPAIAPQVELVDEVQHRMDQVVEAAVEWHQAGREGGEWFDAAEKLGAAIESLLELRSKCEFAEPVTTAPTRQHCGQTMHYDVIVDGDVFDGQKLVGAYYCEQCSVMNPVYAPVTTTAAPTIADAIAAVERLYNEWWDMDRRRCLNVVLERLRALPIAELVTTTAAKAAAEEIVPECLSRTCFIRDCHRGHCWGCDDSRQERERVAAIITRHCFAGGGETKRPRIICLCGSTRFIEQFAITTWELEREGYIVLGCTLLPMWYCKVPSHFGEATGTKEQCDELHKRKIDMADEVLVLNIGGYIGESTRSEIEYATRLGKPVRYIESVDDAAAAALRKGEGN